jgi:phage major head subunit gpT-like protein
MDINRQALNSAYVGFSTAFQRGFEGSQSQWSRIATKVNSTTRTNEYGWLGKIPRFRKWLGDRVINGIAKHGYTLTNEPYENTLGVDRDDFDDDNLGIYSPLFQEMGDAAASFPDELIWPFLKNGFSSKCYDGQYYFDTDHPVLDASGNEYSVANTDGGTGAPWFLIDNSRPLLPVIYQERKAFNRLVRMDKEDDPNVFMKKEYLYGVDGRCAVGFGFWQIAWGSKQPLDAAHYEAARVALGEMKGDYDRPIAIRPKLLIVPPSLEGAARGLIGQMLTTGGETNKWYNTAEIMVCPWLS